MDEEQRKEFNRQLPDGISVDDFDEELDSRVMNGAGSNASDSIWKYVLAIFLTVMLFAMLLSPIWTYHFFGFEQAIVTGFAVLLFLNYQSI